MDIKFAVKLAIRVSLMEVVGFLRFKDFACSSANICVVSVIKLPFTQQLFLPRASV